MRQSSLSRSYIWNTDEDIFSQLYQLVPIKAKLFSFKYYHGVIYVSPTHLPLKFAQFTSEKCGCFYDLAAANLNLRLQKTIYI